MCFDQVFHTHKKKRVNCLANSNWLKSGKCWSTSNVQKKAQSQGYKFQIYFISVQIAIHDAS